MKKFALIGHPVAHSLSPTIHHAFAVQTGINLEYHLIDPGMNNLFKAVQSFQAAGGNGLNITAPFKQQALSCVDRVSTSVQVAGALNTIVIEKNGMCYGDNTDGIGLITDLVKNHQFVLTGKRIVLLGAGGAAYGVVAALLQQKPAELIIANRDLEKAVILYEHFKMIAATENVEFKIYGYDELAGTFDLIINATSASMGNKVPAISSMILTADTCCYDMVYSKTPTAFQAWALHHGVKYAVNGMGMLVEQAAQAFYLWHGVKPNTAEVILNLNKDFFPV